jgi:hypothetical protein
MAAHCNNGNSVHHVVSIGVYSLAGVYPSMKTYCILHKECRGCADGLMYSARFYHDPVDASLPFNVRPVYDGSCSMRLLDGNCHITRMVFQRGKFEKYHQLDMWLRLLEAEPTTETASWERHKKDSEVVRTVRIIDRIKFLTRGS